MPAENTSPDADFWRQLYQANDTPWDLAGPAPPFVELLAQHAMPVATGTIAVAGSGKGHDAALFGRHGYTVTGFDIAPEAIAAAQAAYGNIADFEQIDFFALDRQFDAVVEHTCFCAIPLERRTDYVQTVERIIKPGGWLIGLFWDHGRPGGPPFTVSEAEVRERFSPGFELVWLAKTPYSTAGRADQEWLGLFQRHAS